MILQLPGVRRDLRDAAEAQAIPRARAELLDIALPQHRLWEALGVQHLAVVPRRRVVRGAPRREGPLLAGLRVLAEPHAGEQGVRRVVERLPQHVAAATLLAHDQVAGI